MAPGYNLLHLVLEAVMMSRASFVPLQDNPPQGSGKLVRIVVFRGEVSYIGYVIDQQSNIF